MSYYGSSCFYKIKYASGTGTGIVPTTKASAVPTYDRQITIKAYI